jgi:hypothetical protein
MTHRLAVLRRALSSPQLRRVELAFLGFGIAEYGVWVVVLVYAFRRGGTTEAGVIAAVQLMPSAVVAPMTARLIAARGAAATLWAGYLAQALSLALTAALMLAGTPSAIVYAGAVVAASAVTLTRPAQGALLPALVQTPAQLTAANVISGWAENVTLLAGPAVASVMLVAAGPGWALSLFAAIVASAAAVVAPLRWLGDDGAIEDEEAPGSLRAAIRAAPGAAPALAMLTAEYVVLGALDVLEVVIAATLLGLGSSGAGYLGAAFGAGGLVGAAAALTLVGRHRLAQPLLLAGTVWGAAFAAIGVWPGVGTALALLAAAGAARTVLDVGGRTVLHRAVPRALHAPVFSALEGLEMFGLAIGSLAVPLLTAVAGTRGTLAAIGGLLLVVPVLTMPVLRRIEQAAPAVDAELAILRDNALFSMLGAPVLEDLARAMVRTDVPHGNRVIREGEPGDQYFVVASGQLDVSIAGSSVETLTAHDGFGEIALLHDGVRTATVTATTDVTLYALGRAPFLEAVTGSAQAHRAVRELVAQRLA